MSIRVPARGMRWIKNGRFVALAHFCRARIQRAGPIDNRASARTSPMPIYEYICDECGQAFEALVRATTEAACPQCGATRLSKQLSVFATSAAHAAPAVAGPCGTCGHPDGPGSCALR
jgi:putative FmdB family regulatory protein